jgi:prepilin-type N-terminal cleavage/methylation domain-containing protein
MRITHTAVVPVSRGRARRRKMAGFTLIELMIAVTVFLIIGGAAMMLFKRHVSQFTDQQNQVGLNTSLRNALTQMEVDIANAGTGYFTTVDKANFPIGITIGSGGSTVACNNGQTYPAACFDTLNILSLDSTTPPGQADAGNQTGCTDTTSGIGSVIIPPAGSLNPATNLPWTAAQYAALFNNGDQVLFSSSLNYNTSVLTANAAVGAGGDISLQFQKTSAATFANSTTTDKLGISTAPDPQLQTSFCAGTSWVVKLAPAVTYGVDTATNPANPTLFRRVGGVGVQTPIADQIIGFRLVTTLNNCNVAMTDWPAPGAQPLCAGTKTNFNQIRTVQISLIGRTTPVPSSADNFHNAFDQGPYRIEAVSVTASPRNLSMND